MTRVSTSNIQCDGFPATFPNDSPEGCPQDRVVDEFITNFGEEGWSSLVIEDGGGKADGKPTFKHFCPACTANGFPGLWLLKAGKVIEAEVAAIRPRQQRE